MASEHTLKSDSYQGRYLQLDLTQDKDIATNKSTITWTLSSKGGSSNYYSTGPTTVKIAGNEVYYLARKNWDSKVFPAAKGSVSGTITVDHDSEGKKSVDVSLITAIYTGTTSTKTETWTLDSIPRQATLTSAPNFTDLENPTIYYTNPAGNSVNALEACISFNLQRITEDIPYRAIEKTDESYMFPLTDEERNKLRNAAKNSNTITVQFVVRTKIGSSTFWSQLNRTLSIVENDNTRPTVTMTTELNNGSLPSKFDGMYIQGKSKLDVKLSATPKYSATIKSYSATLKDASGKVVKTYNSNDFTTDAIQIAGNVSLTGEAKDSRGFTGSKKKQIEVVSYSKPLVIPFGNETAILCYRSDENGNRSGNSETVRIKAMRIYHPFSGKNQCALQWRRKKSKEVWDEGNEEHKWHDLMLPTSPTNTEYNALLTVDNSTEKVKFELTKSYTVQIRAIDDIGESDVKTFTIPTEDVALHLGKGGKNVSVGTYCDYLTPYIFFSLWEGNFVKGLWGTSLNYNVSDVLKFAEERPNGLTPIITNDSTNKANLPAGYYENSVGIIHKRSEKQCCVYLTDYVSGKIAINILKDGTWSGWKYITPQ